MWRKQILKPWQGMMGKFSFFQEQNSWNLSDLWKNLWNLWNSHYDGGRFHCQIFLVGCDSWRSKLGAGEFILGEEPKPDQAWTLKVCLRHIFFFGERFNIFCAIFAAFWECSLHENSTRTRTMKSRTGALVFCIWRTGNIATLGPVSGHIEARSLYRPAASTTAQWAWIQGRWLSPGGAVPCWKIGDPGPGRYRKVIERECICLRGFGFHKVLREQCDVETESFCVPSSTQQ